MRVIARRGF